MQWYYASNNKQEGPVSEEELRRLTSVGSVKPDSLVWREGMSEWEPFSKVFGSNAAPIAPAATTSGSTSAAVCPTCGSRTESNNLIPVGDTVVCPSCRDSYSQRLKEGGHADFDGVMDYAGFWIRAGASIIDSIILNVIQFVFGLIAGAAGAASQPGDPGGAQIMITLIGVVISFGYAIFFLGSSKFQATPGMMACKIRIIVADGSDCSYARATGRLFASILSTLTFGIGYLMVIWDKENRTLHDMICNTRVIRN